MSKFYELGPFVLYSQAGALTRSGASTGLGSRVAVLAALLEHPSEYVSKSRIMAARVRSLSVEQIRAHLHDRFKLLTGGSHMALPRQQTLRATLDWSFDLLGEQERAVLRRLAVFAGGFTLEAASAVTCEKTMDEFAVIDLLSARALAGRCRYQRW